MPKLFMLFGYSIYFWTNEGEPLEPVHVHVSKGTPSGNSTKIWIAKSGMTLVANNNSKIPDKALKAICKAIELRSDEIISAWNRTFNETCFYL